jgi:hypothetical protein
LSEDLIIAHPQKNGNAYNLSPDNMIKLKGHLVLQGVNFVLTSPEIQAEFASVENL